MMFFCYKKNKNNNNNNNKKATAGLDFHDIVHTWWFVLRLSICFLKTLVQKSLQMNFMTSSSSLKRGVSLVNLQTEIMAVETHLLKIFFYY